MSLGQVYEEQGNPTQVIPFLYQALPDWARLWQTCTAQLFHIQTYRYSKMLLMFQERNWLLPGKLPKDHPYKIIWLSSVTCEPLKHWGEMVETYAAALSRHSASSFLNDYSLIPQISPSAFRLQFSMWLLPFLWRWKWFSYIPTCHLIYRGQGLWEQGLWDQGRADLYTQQLVLDRNVKLFELSLHAVLRSRSSVF